MNRQIETILEKYRGEMVEKLRELIRIPSITVADNSDCTPDAPYGEGAKEALDYMIALGESKGFRAKNYDNQAATLDFGEELDDAVGIVSHVDVVPVSDSWTVDPFGGEVRDGKIYGRGAIDDKGPAIAAFYAALAIKESGLPLKRNVTQIIGTNEEGGNFPCIKHYLKTAEKVPSWGIVPDSFFPICFSEKHFVNFELNVSTSGKCSGKRILKSIKGGDAINIVPAWAEAVFMDEDGNELETIKASGASAHASTPWEGENAIAKLLNILAEQEFEPKELCDGIKTLSKLVCNDTDGKGLGISFKDETGETTNNLGLISYEDGKLITKSNSRLPLSLTGEKAAEIMREKTAGTNVEFELTHVLEGFYTDVTKDPGKTMIEVYREESEDMDSKPYANGSGSYARIMDGFVPFGVALTNEPLQFHIEDESLSEERLWLATKIYAEALYRLATK